MKMKPSTVLVIRVENNGKIEKQTTFLDAEAIELEQYFQEYKRRFPFATISIQKPMIIEEE